MPPIIQTSIIFHDFEELYLVSFQKSLSDLAILPIKDAFFPVELTDFP